MPKQTFFLSPSFPSPSYSLPRSLHSHHATDELKESMSVGRQGGEKRKKEDIRKNSFSEFLNKKRALDLHRLVSFRGWKAVIWVSVERSTFVHSTWVNKNRTKYGTLISCLFPLEQLGLSVHKVLHFYAFPHDVSKRLKFPFKKENRS